jgi:hypothetical protein
MRTAEKKSARLPILVIPGNTKGTQRPASAVGAKS